jgi:nuclear transport factor 2 (NTF2) superfamily protein
VAFIADRDSFYMATVSETGWPYVQHRGGPRGFLKLIDDHTVAFADYRGNRQYISTGNLMADDRACLFLMDYPRRVRLKIYAHVETLALDDDPELTALVTMPDYRARLERIFRLRLKTFDWNCQQHITPRFTEHDIAEAIRPLRDRLASSNPKTPSYARVFPPMENPNEHSASPFAAVHAGKRGSKGPPRRDYRLMKELSAFRENRIAVRFAYEWHDDGGNWFRSYANENWEFDENGPMRRRFACINDAPIRGVDRCFHWPLGRRADDHHGLSDMGF